MQVYQIEESGKGLPGGVPDSYEAPKCKSLQVVGDGVMAIHSVWLEHGGQSGPGGGGKHLKGRWWVCFSTMLRSLDMERFRKILRDRY